MSGEFITGGAEALRYAPPSGQPASSLDHRPSEDDSIKESFRVFSLRIQELDEQLGKFASSCLKLERAAHLLLVIKRTRDRLRRIRQVFFRNATALVPHLLELAREDYHSKTRASNSERFYVPPQYFNEHLPPFNALPEALEELGASFLLLHDKINEFREFTDEGLLLKSYFLTLHHVLMAGRPTTFRIPWLIKTLQYRGSCAGDYSNRLNTPLIQRYIHQFIHELRSDFETVTVALGEFSTVGISAIGLEQRQSSSSLSNMLTVSTLFSGITASALQMSMGRPDQNNAVLVTNVLWCLSLIFSVGAALNNLMIVGWNGRILNAFGSTPFMLITSWMMDVSQLVFLKFSIMTFSAGLIVFTFASSQASYTPYLAITSTAFTFFCPLASVFYISYRILHFPTFQRGANIIRSSGDSVYSEFSSSSLVSGGIVKAITNALPFLRFKERDLSQDDVEKIEEKISGPMAEPPTLVHNFPDPLKMKLQGKVAQVAIINSALDALKTAGRRNEPAGCKQKRQPKPKAQMSGGSAAAPLTELILSDEPSSIIELARLGAIRDVAFSDDGRWLAVTCTKQHIPQSWTGVFDAETLETRLDTWHEGRVISEHLKWSPSGKKMIVKFEHRFDIWDLDATVLRVIERHHAINDVAWLGEDAFLVAERSCVFQMNMTRLMAVYRFEHSHIRSIGFDRANNYLFLITRAAHSQGQYKLSSAQLEKRIVIYDMEKRETLYVVPLLENIYFVYPIQGTLDILIAHKDQKAFQLWSLDAGIRNTEITTKLKKRVVVPHLDSRDYTGPTRVAGNYNQFILNVSTSGEIDVWSRESGMPYKRFQLPILRDEGIRCLSWRRSADETATFATAGIDSHTLLVWRGEERLIPEVPASPEYPILPSPKLGTGGSHWSRVPRFGGAFSGSLSPREIEPIETITESIPNIM